ncbi:hypothetical protein LI142_23280 [Eubacterium limosum]|uniref:hypothetical protein n=1 Tax=Eubacterium limosum TaxID=1736 RepID=UPI001D08C950|nr:hypothetical protein [Eubacterium limosum]MCB6572416.1 hypothetical protein [Eubacterium limosum]
MTDSEYQELADQILTYGILCQTHGATNDYVVFLNEAVLYNEILEKLCKYTLKKDEKEKTL